jgi:hypothetical protein
MFVLRRLDCLLEPTKEAVLEEVRFQREEVKLTELEPDGLCDAPKYVFYNTSRFTLKSLLGNHSQLEANFKNYLFFKPIPSLPWIQKHKEQEKEGTHPIRIITTSVRSPSSHRDNPEGDSPKELVASKKNLK